MRLDEAFQVVAFHGLPRCEHADPPAARQCRRRLHGRDNADERQREARAQGVEGDNGHRVAGNDHERRMLPREQSLGDGDGRLDDAGAFLSP